MRIEDDGDDQSDFNIDYNKYIQLLDVIFLGGDKFQIAFQQSYLI